MAPDGSRFSRVRRWSRVPLTVLALSAVAAVGLEQAATATATATVRSLARVAPTKPSASSYLALAGHLSSEIAADIGHPLSLTLHVVINPTQMEGAKTLAYAAPEDSTGGGSGPATQCVVHVNPLLYKSKTVTDTNATMAHEVFHCFEAMDYPSIAAFSAAPDWLIEGEAEWVGATLEPAPDDFWNSYLTSLKTPLFSRSYSAIGFYAHLSNSGEDTWHLLDAMLKAGGSAAAYAVAANANVRMTWASSLARQGGFGKGWDTTGPGITGDRYTPSVSILKTGTVLKGAVAPYTNALVPFDPTADVVTIATSAPYERLHEADATDIDGPAIANNYCVKDCDKCPEMKSLPKMPAGATWLAVTGDTAGATYSVTGGPPICACIFGSWTVTSASGAIGTGEAGVMWTVSPDGRIVVDYAASAPLMSPAGLAYTYRGVADYTTTIPPNPVGSTGAYDATPTTQDVTATYTIPGIGTKTTPVTEEGHHTTWSCTGNSLELHVSAAGAILNYALARNGT